MLVESLRAGVALLPRAWRRPGFVALMAATTAAGLGMVVAADAASWLSPVIVGAILLLPPLVQGPLYSLAIPKAPPEPTMADRAARYARLLAVDLLTLLFLAVPALLLCVVALGVAYGMAYANPGFNPTDAATWTANGPVLLGDGAVCAMGGLTMLWLVARVSLGPAASVAERRVVMLSTWPLTRGLGWRIAAARLVLGAVALVMVWLVERVVPHGESTRFATLVCYLLFVGVGLPVEVGVMSYFFARRSPLPVTS